MNTSHLIDPELLPGLEMLLAIGLGAMELGHIREAIAHPRAELPPLPIEAEIKVIDGPDGPLEIFWFDPAPGEIGRPALLHIQGGGMILGSVHQMQAGPASLAASSGLPVASVEYRLAPETPFPGPQEDCYAALVWLAESAGTLGVDPQRVAICGESAGGGLAAAVAQMARDKSGPSLAAQFLTYPMLDHRTGSESCPYRNKTTGEFVWTRQANQFGWEAARGTYDPVDQRKGWFSPSLADDLAGLPATWIGVGALDLFLDENLDYARRLASAGVPVELHCYAGAYHGFDMVPGARITRTFGRDLADAIANTLLRA